MKKPWVRAISALSRQRTPMDHSPELGPSLRRKVVPWTSRCGLRALSKHVSEQFLATNPSEFNRHLRMLTDMTKSELQKSQEIQLATKTTLRERFWLIITQAEVVCILTAKTVHNDNLLARQRLAAGWMRLTSTSQPARLLLIAMLTSGCLGNPY